MVGLPGADMRWLLRSFPAAWQAAEASFAEGEDEYETAAFLTAWMLTHVIENVMSVDERELVRAQLEAWSTFEGAGGQAPSHPWARAFALLTRQTETMVATARIRPAAGRFVWSEVIGALQGKDRQQRREARLVAAGVIRPISPN
jgi:hypothetical protein